MAAMEYWRRSLLRATIDRYWSMNGPTWAAAVALRIIQATIPTLVFCLALVSLVIDPHTDSAARAGIAAATPAVLRSSVVAELTTLHNDGGIGVLSFVVLLWTGSGVFGCLESCMARAYGTTGRSLKRQKLLAFGLWAGIALVMALWLVWSVSRQATGARAGAIAGPSKAVSIGHMVTFMLVAATIGFIYHVLPDLRLPWRHTVPGAGTALLGGVLLSVIWPIYAHLAGQTSSSHAAFILLVAVVTYVYVFSEIAVLGIALNAVVRERSALSTTAFQP